MKLGITRWKMVPSYSGTPCFLAWVTGLAQSFVPSARPMKLATPMGALSGNSLHVSLPAVVSMIAVDCPEPVDFAALPGFLASLEGAACDQAISEIRQRKENIAKHLRIDCLLASNLNLQVSGSRTADSSRTKVRSE